MVASTTLPTRRDRWIRWAVIRKVLALVVAVSFAVLGAPVPAAWAGTPVNGATDGGPGIWRPAKLGGAPVGSVAGNYEQQITGVAPGQLDYWVPLPETRDRPGFDIHTWQPINRPGVTSDGVAFDGYDQANDVLLEAKGPRYAYLLDPKNAKWSGAEKDLLDEAARQARAASATDTQIRWEFAEEGAREHMQPLLTNMGIGSTFTAPAEPPLLDAPGSPADPLGNVEQGGAVEENPGGIDFSTLQLHYLSATTAPDGSVGLKYSFQNGLSAVPGDKDNARQASDAFFVWLELNPSQFWVNLNPHQPDTIIDPALAKTDVGKVLLESDLQLKKSITDLMNADTQLGNEFWQKIYHGPDNDHCFWVRNWIVPSPATVRPSGTDLYVMDAPLTVMSDNLHDGSNTCPGQTQQRADYNEQVIHDLLLPAVTQEVNTAPEFAALRRVYLSRVVAEWYRQLSADHNTQYRSLIGQGIVGPWVSRTPWNPVDVFNQYVKLVDGTHSVITVDGVQYEIVYGGVDFSQAPSDPVTQQQFQTRWPTLPKTVDKSISTPTVDSDGKTIWFGGTSVVPAARSAPPSSSPPRGGGSLPNTGSPVWYPALAGLVLCMMGLGLLVLLRRTRNRIR